MDKLLSRMSKLPSGCWEWTGTKDRGYGYVAHNGKTTQAHRAVYEELVGPIPSGLQIDHLCRNRSCVNPKHLELVTQRVNILRGEGLTAQNARKTHCAKGHEFSTANTYHRKSNGVRECAACRRTWHKRAALKANGGAR